MPNPIIKFFSIAKEEGLGRALFRTFRRAVRPLVRWEVYILVSKPLDDRVPVPPLPPGYTIKLIGEADVDRVIRDMGFEARMAEVYRARLAHSVRGYYVENDRGEVCAEDWRAPGPAPHLGEINQMALAEGEVMFLDGHVREDQRGKGIHSALFPHMLLDAYRDGFIRGYVLHVPENAIAIHIHDEKFGMRPIKKFWVCYYVGRVKVVERQIKQRNER